jgi:hypothetical protein
MPGREEVSHALALPVPPLPSLQRHALYFADSSTGPDIGREYVYTCPKPPCTMRVYATDRWEPAREKPPEAIVVKRGDGAGRAETY